MSSDPARARKLADRIQQVVAGMLERRIKDPRLGFVTVTDARVTGDLREATIYYTVYGEDQERAETAAALESAKGILRSEVGRQLGTRHTPSLAFVPDYVPANAKLIDDLVQRARHADAEVARNAREAEPAGEPDPYRRTGEDLAEPADHGLTPDRDEGGTSRGGHQSTGRNAPS